MSPTKAIFAFETSCDETAVALISDTGKILFEKVFSQIETHRKFGGVVPEVASRSHFEKVDELAQLALEHLKAQNIQLSAMAATQGPGLIGALLVGSTYAQGLAAGLQIPFIGVHHLRGHIASVLLGQASTHTLAEQSRKTFPALVLLVSGGHTQILYTDEHLSARPLLSSVDDAAGECFDKCAKLMGLNYPGGPEIERLAGLSAPLNAAKRTALLKDLPRPKTQDGDFSFSGLKTAIRTQLEKNPGLQRDPDFCWAIQEVIAEILVKGLDRALLRLQATPLPLNLVFCGGVSANLRIRDRVSDWARQKNLQLHLAPIRYCTDNAAMIGTSAWVQDSKFHFQAAFARQALE